MNTESPQSPPESIGNIARTVLNRHERRAETKRAKVFDFGDTSILSPRESALLLFKAKSIRHARATGEPEERLSHVAIATLRELLFTFHNRRNGRCFPAYEKIAEAVGCARSSVAEAINALERFGLITWVNRLKRIWVACSDLLGNQGRRKAVVRASNSYSFGKADPPSKSDSRTATTPQMQLQPKNVPEKPKEAPIANPGAMKDRIEAAILKRRESG